MIELRDNLKREMEAKGWNAYDLEDACEKKGAKVPQPTINRILSGKHGDPRASTVKKLAIGLGISEARLRGLESIEDQVVRQQLPDLSIEQPSDKKRISHPELKPVEIVAWENPEDLPDDQYAIIPRVRLKLSAGNGTMITEELPDAPLAFTTEWIKRKRVKRSNLVIVNATGDSMEPTICCGALLLIDTASTEIIDGKVYALRYGDELRVKRLYKRYDGGIIIRSDNSSKYPDETLTATDLNEHIYVIGRVIWQAGDL